MKITLNHSKLAKSLQYTSKAVNAKPNIPILSNVLMEVEDSNLKLSATNLDMGINVWIPGKSEQDGQTTVSARYIADFVAASSGDKVEIELKENVLNVQTSKSKANFATIAASEFPVLPKIGEKPLFRIAASEFIASMDKVIFACSTDFSAGKIQQTGVLFEITEADKEEISFIGLDGFRLSKRTAKIAMDSELPSNQLIVPARYLNEVVKVALDYPELENIAVYLSENKSQLIFKFEDVEISIRLIEGPYPDYKRIMPDSSSYAFDVKRVELEEALKVINTFARSNLSNKTLMDFEIEDSTITLRSSVMEVGDNQTVLEVSSVDAVGDLNSAYNLKFIIDVVNHLSGENLRFETKGPLSATVIKDKSDIRFMHLLMPLRRDE